MKYFYAPLFEDLETPSTSVGTLVDGVMEEAPLISGMSMPICDRTVPQFVVISPDAFVAPTDWIAKTKAEVIADYPQLGV